MPQTCTSIFRLLDDYKLKIDAKETLAEIWRFFKNSPMRLRIYMKETHSDKEFDFLTENKKTNYVKLLKKTLRAR